jgi:hypothetical protein
MFLLAAAGGLVGWGLRRVRAGAVVATVVSADGPVLVRRDGVERPVVQGLVVYDGEQITVPDEASAVLALPDASRAELGPETSLWLHHEDAALELRGGFVAVNATHRPADRPLAIRTPGARAEVLGTRFTLGADDAKTHLRVAEGLVHLLRIGDGAAVDVPGGHRAVVADGDRAGLELRPSLPGTVLLIASYDRAPTDFVRFNRLVGDHLLGRRLRHLGFRVETKAHADVTAGDLVHRPLVIVSFSEWGVGFEQSLERIGLRAADVPLLCFEPMAFPTLGLTGGRQGVDYDWGKGPTPVEFPSPDHPLSGGLAGERSDLFFDRPGTFGWARPGRAAARIATLPGDGARAVLFAYEAGADMIESVAPRRRVGLFLDPSQVSDRSEAAWSLVEAAVEWCAEPPRGQQGRAER